MGMTISSISKKRIIKEYNEIIRDKISFDIPFNNTSPSELGIRISPIRGNILEWHFSFTGPEYSDYAKGVYHGRIILHQDYPRKPPTVSMLSPNGRWEVKKDICLSASAHHDETWNLDWNLRTLVLSLRHRMICTPTELGSIESTQGERLMYAKQSRHWLCSTCGVNHELMLVPNSNANTSTTSSNNNNNNNRSSYNKKHPSIMLHKKVTKSKKSSLMSLGNMINNVRLWLNFLFKPVINLLRLI
jgi:ubiquitin-protein ligase